MSGVLTSQEASIHSPNARLTADERVDERQSVSCEANWLERICRNQLVSRLRRLAAGRLTIIDPLGQLEFGESLPTAPHVQVRVRHPRLYPQIVRGGSLGAAESYLRGDWDSDDVTAVLRLFAANAHLLGSLDRWHTRLTRPLTALLTWQRRNTRAGSRRNIAAHYDLSNDFFALMLDRTMTYSSGIFAHADSTLEEASRAKYDRICRKLQLSADDHVLEIGCGWGGFALHAAGNYGCRVTATTISRQQYLSARDRIQAAGLHDRITLLLRDYRDLSGSYDKLVSIEMIEAVGERMLDAFFGQCARLLTPGGAMLLQAILIPDDRYDRYRTSLDFINRYVFPGGFLPSLSAIGMALRRATDFRVIHLEDFADHYARTLACWRTNFSGQLEQVRRLGFDEHFVRTWHYYLCYCEAGFAERQIGVSQMLLTRPKCRLNAPLHSVTGG